MNTQEMGIANFRGYGREDVLLEGYPDRNVQYDFEKFAHIYGVTARQLESAYNQGKQEAAQEKQQHPALFYLNELLTRLDPSDEWYGTDFDVPRWIVQQIIAICG